MSLVSLSELLAGSRPGEHVIALCGLHSITLDELRGAVAHNARRFERLPVRRALLACDDGYRFLVGLLSLLHTGVDIILLPNMQPGTLAHLAGTFDVLVTDAAPPEAPSCLTIEGAAPSAREVCLDTTRSRIHFFTSGSTGAMKRIEKTAPMLERETAALERLWGAELGDARIFGTVSHQHIYGLTFRVMWPLLAGRCFSSCNHFAWETLLGELSAPAAIVSSPAHLTRLGGLSPMPPALRPRTIFTAGAPLPPRAVRDAEAVFGTAPVEIFGSTETGAFAWRRAPNSQSWTPLPGVEVACGDGGLARVRSSFTGDAWCDLADRISIGPNGDFRFEGRADRIVKVEGKRVSLQQLEGDLAALPWIVDAAAAVLPGERPILGAVVTLSDAGKAELARLGRFQFGRLLRRDLGTTLEAAALPRRWRFVERMPTDGMGKRRTADIAALLETKQ